MFRSEEGRTKQVVTGAQPPLKKKPQSGYWVSAGKGEKHLLLPAEVGTWDVQLLWRDPYPTEPLFKPHWWGPGLAVPVVRGWSTMVTEAAASWPRARWGSRAVIIAR